MHAAINTLGQEHKHTTHRDIQICSSHTDQHMYQEDTNTLTHIKRRHAHTPVVGGAGISFPAREEAGFKEGLSLCEQRKVI